MRTPSVLTRNSVFQQTQKEADPFLFGPYFKMNDIQMWIGIIQLSDVAYISEPTVMYRINDGSMSRPKKYYDDIRFQLSMKELRIYYNQKYGYLKKEIQRIKNDYIHLLRIYREHDSSFKGVLDIPDLYENEFQHTLFRLKNVWWHLKYNLHKIK